MKKITTTFVAELIRKIFLGSLYNITDRRLPLSSEEAISFCELWGNPVDREEILKMVRKFFSDPDGVFGRHVGHEHRFILNVDVEACDGELFIIPSFAVQTPTTTPYSTATGSTATATGNRYMESFSAPKHVDVPTLLFISLPLHCASPWDVLAYMMAHLGLLDDKDQWILEMAFLDTFGSVHPPKGFTASLVYDHTIYLNDEVKIKVPRIVITETEETKRGRLDRSYALKKRLLEALEECPAIIKRHKANPQGEPEDIKKEDIKKEVIVIT